jgi:fructose-1,6-bisphosphatase II
MVTQVRPVPQSKNFGENIESDLALEFLRVVENAAIESARTMGQGDRPLSDQMATEAMRKTMDTVPMHGTIVIGEGERDDAPMLYIGEQVGGPYSDGRGCPHVDIAVDPLEGTNLCATGAPGAITVLAASEKGGTAACSRLLYGEDCGGAVVQECGGTGRSGRRQFEKYCAAAASRS